MSQYYKNRQKWTVKAILILLFTTMVFPSNYSGASLTHHSQKGTTSGQNMAGKNGRGPTLFPPNSLILGETGEMLKIESVQIEKSPSIMLVISRPELCWTAVVPIVSIILINVILAYLCDQPTNKQCLINLLYRDVLAINITHVCLWSFGMLYCEYRGQIPFEETQAQCIAYTNHLLSLLILAYLNAIGVLRLCTVKFKQVNLVFMRAIP